MRLQRHPRVRLGGQHGHERQCADDEDPADRVAGPPRNDQRADRGWRAGRREEERVQPPRAGPGHVLRGGDAIKRKPSGRQDEGRKGKAARNQARRHLHGAILSRTSADRHSAATEVREGEGPMERQRSRRRGRGNGV